jgi:hypothetical protein
MLSPARVPTSHPFIPLEREIEKREKKDKILPLAFEVTGSPIIMASNPVLF